MALDAPTPKRKQPKKTGNNMVIYELRGAKGGGRVLQRMAGVSILLLSVLNASADMIAPILPQAADIPCGKARYRAGSTELVSLISKYKSTRQRGHL